MGHPYSPRLTSTWRLLSKHCKSACRHFAVIAAPSCTGKAEDAGGSMALGAALHCRQKGSWRMTVPDFSSASVGSSQVYPASLWESPGETCSTKHPVWASFSSLTLLNSPEGLPGILSQINHIHLNSCLRVCLWGNPTQNRTSAFDILLPCKSTLLCSGPGSAHKACAWG